MKFTSMAMAIAVAAFMCGCCTCNEHDRDKNYYTVKVHRSNGTCFPANFKPHNGKGLGMTREVLTASLGDGKMVEEGVYPVRLWNPVTGTVSEDEIGYIYLNRNIR